MMQTIQNQEQFLKELQNEYEETKNKIGELEEKFSISYKSLMQLIINQFENSSKMFEQSQDLKDKVHQIQIDPAKLIQISQENEFFLYLYQSINDLITENGQTPEAFQDLIQKQFPCRLSDFSDNEAMKALIKVQQLQQEGDEAQEAMLLEQIRQQYNLAGGAENQIDFDQYQALQQATGQLMMDEQGQFQIIN